MQPDEILHCPGVVRGPACKALVPPMDEVSDSQPALPATIIRGSIEVYPKAGAHAENVFRATMKGVPGPWAEQVFFGLKEERKWRRVQETVEDVGRRLEAGSTAGRSRI